MTTKMPTGRTPAVKIVGTILLFVAVLAVLALSISATSTPVEAKFPIDNFTNVDDTATVTPSGQNLAVSGWVKCTEGHIAEISVIVTQGSTEATGQTHVRCLGQTETRQWEIHVASRGPEAFDASRSVRVDARAVTRYQGERTDGPHTWSNDAVTLIERYSVDSTSAKSTR